MEALRDYWPMVLAAVATIALMARLEMGARETAEWRERHEKAVNDGFAGVNARLDSINGKVYRHEGEIARLIGGRS